MAANKITKVRCNVVLKTPGEVIVRPVDFSQYLASGETLTGQSGQAAQVNDATGVTTTDLSIAVGTIGSTSVPITVSGGLDGITYGIVLLFTTNAGQTLEAYCPLEVAAR